MARTGRSRPTIAILTVATDLHALAVRKDLDDRHDVNCSIIETDRLPGTGSLSWSNVTDLPATLASDLGDPVPVAELDVIWWRRANTPPHIPAEVTDDAHRELITNDCQSAVLGVLLTEFEGTWVSEPLATRRAENKLVQLKAAAAAGFRTPRTLVSQDPHAIRRFCRELDGEVIVKPVRGTQIRPPLTSRVDKRLLAEDRAMSLSPAIYQEFVRGTRHVRAHVFGDRVYAAELQSSAVDWRADMNIPVRPVELPTEVEDRLRDVVVRLGLRMGVVDLKRTEDGDLVWLEINPQGQFLFIEGLCGLPLTSALGDFLVHEASVSVVRDQALS